MALLTFKTDCDFLVSSAYKFFGPHAGILYGKRELLEKLFAYKVRPATNTLPGRFEQAHKTMKGLLVCWGRSNISSGSAENLEMASLTAIIKVAA
jgi:selenocysteine lyase/cysteine desulfurase